MSIVQIEDLVTADELMGGQLSGGIDFLLQAERFVVLVLDLQSQSYTPVFERGPIGFGDGRAAGWGRGGVAGGNLGGAGSLKKKKKMN